MGKEKLTMTYDSDHLSQVQPLQRPNLVQGSLGKEPEDYPRIARLEDSSLHEQYSTGKQEVFLAIRL